MAFRGPSTQPDDLKEQVPGKEAQAQIQKDTQEFTPAPLSASSAIGSTVEQQQTEELPSDTSDFVTRGGREGLSQEESAEAALIRSQASEDSFEDSVRNVIGDELAKQGGSPFEDSVSNIIGDELGEISKQNAEKIDLNAFVSEDQINRRLPELMDADLRMRAFFEDTENNVIQAFRAKLGDENVRYDMAGDLIWRNPGEKKFRTLDKFELNLDSIALDFSDIAGDATEVGVDVAASWAYGLSLRGLGWVVKAAVASGKMGIGRKLTAKLSELVAGASLGNFARRKRAEALNPDVVRGTSAGESAFQSGVLSLGVGGGTVVLGTGVVALAKKAEPLLRKAASSIAGIGTDLSVFEKAGRQQSELLQVMDKMSDEALQLSNEFGRKIFGEEIAQTGTGKVEKGLLTLLSEGLSKDLDGIIGNG